MMLIRLLAVYLFGSKQNPDMFSQSFKVSLNIFLIVPFFEELIFRDYLIWKFDDYEYKNIITAVIFGLVHLPIPLATYLNIRDKIIYLLISVPILIYVGYICALQNSILKSTFIHCIYNVITTYAIILLYKYTSKKTTKISMNRRYIRNRRNSLPKYKDKKEEYSFINVHSTIKDLWKDDLMNKYLSKKHIFDLE